MMNSSLIESKQRIIQWVTGGPYAVAVEVEAIIPIDDPSEPCLTPETVRYLEQVADWAEAGDVAALKRAGTVEGPGSGVQISELRRIDVGSCREPQSPQF